MTNTFKQADRKLTAISHCESSGELSVSMVLAHTFSGIIVYFLVKLRPKIIKVQTSMASQLATVLLGKDNFLIYSAP